MKACALLALAAVASAQHQAGPSGALQQLVGNFVPPSALAVAALQLQPVPPGALQQLVDGIFERYLPAEQQGHVCPFARISEQCELFNSSMAEIKTCHMECGHGDFSCHMNCPRAKPQSIQELQRLGEAMVCHKMCGKDDAPCHKACKCPFGRKQAACGKLAEVVECHKRGGDHTTCKLDADAKELLLAEPWSLVKDVADHVVDFLLPAAQPLATEQEVHSCHSDCGHDGPCHRACPKGQWGALKDQCATLDAQKACHQACKSQETKCPFKKMSCHMKCPMSMPSSVDELKATAEHIACHAECRTDGQCHKSCPIARQWTERKERCAEYERVAACHKGCGREHDCHAQCASIDFPDSPPAVSSPNSMAKQVVGGLFI